MSARVRDVEEAVAALRREAEADRATWQREAALLRREVRALQRAATGRGPLTGAQVERSYDADGATPAADGRTTR